MLVLVVAAAACSCTRNSPPVVSSSEAAGDSVRMQVGGIGYDRGSGSHFVLLTDSGQTRQLPIMIGDNEAEAIMLEMHGLEAPRPLTHDLMRSIIEKTGNHVDRIEISELKEEVYYARIVLDSGRYSIDSRPSDALALALKTNAPIYANPKLLLDSTGGGTGPVSLPAGTRALGITVQDLTPALSDVFKVPTGSGVLVADADNSAQKAGIVRGDVVTRVGVVQVRRVTDFVGAVSKAQGEKSISITIERSGHEQQIVLPSRLTHN